MITTTEQSNATQAETSFTQNTNSKSDWPAMLLISANIVYIGCYFMPYMFLAFIHDPFLTIFIYLMVALFTVCIYLICLSVWYLCKFCMKCKVAKVVDVERLTEEKDAKNNCKDKDKEKDNNKLPKFFDALLYSYMAFATATSVTMFLFVIIYIITMGSFDDFRELQNLIPSLLTAVLVVFLLQPAYKYTLRKAQYDTGNRNNVQLNTSDQIVLILKKAILSVGNDQNPTTEASSQPVDK